MGLATLCAKYPLDPPGPAVVWGDPRLLGPRPWPERCALSPDRALVRALHAARWPAVSREEELPPVPGGRQQAIVIADKHRRMTQQALVQAWRGLAPGGQLILAGDNEIGIASSIRALSQALAQAPEDQISKSHARLAVFRRDDGPGPQAPERQVVPLFAGDDAPLLRTAPGVFSDAHLDAGTALLQACLAEQAPVPRVVDLGCGVGHLGLWCLWHWPQTQTLLADNSRVACDMAVGNALRLGLGQRCRVDWWDAAEGALEGEAFDLGLCNPPCHQGTKTDLSIASAMFTALAQMLRPGGRMLIVANRHLPYERELQGYGRVQSLAQDAGFKILCVDLSTG